MNTKINIDTILDKIKNTIDKKDLGMILIHNGIVRETSKHNNQKLIQHIQIKYDKNKLQYIINQTRHKQGIADIFVWINEGILSVGDNIMYVIVAGDRQTNILKPFESLIEYIKNNVIEEIEY